MTAKEKEMINKALMICDLNWEFAYQEYKAADNEPHTDVEQAKAAAKGEAFTIARIIIYNIGKGDADMLEEMYTKLNNKYKEMYETK